MDGEEDIHGWGGGHTWMGRRAYMDGENIHGWGGGHTWMGRRAYMDGEDIHGWGGGLYYLIMQ